MFKLISLCVVLAIVQYSDAQVKSRAIQNFFCNGALNKQVKTEFEAAQTYLSLSNHFAHDSQALHGFSKMFEHHWKEELEHGEKIMNYVTKRGGTVCTPHINKPDNDNKWNKLTACKVLETALELERNVTNALLDLHACARGDMPKLLDSNFCNKQGDCEFNCVQDENSGNVEDPQLQDFLEAEYLGEQVDGIKELADLLTKLERTTAGRNCDGLGLHMIDEELKSKYSK